jgi:hypothetical protein
LTPDAAPWPPGLRFLPWVGEGYGRPNGLGLPERLLILGMSHHARALESGAPGIDRGPELTRELVRRHVETGAFRFFTIARRFVLGPASGAADRAPFWRAVAFSNLVQRLYERPYEGLRAADARASAEAFAGVLERLGPSHVLVLGLDLWRRMPAAEGEGPSVEAGGASRPTALHRAGGRRALAMAITHPAAFGFSYEPWHSLARVFLARNPAANAP